MNFIERLMSQEPYRILIGMGLFLLSSLLLYLIYQRVISVLKRKSLIRKPAVNSFVTVSYTHLTLPTKRIV